jgi:hypothetical protein
MRGGPTLLYRGVRVVDELGEPALALIEGTNNKTAPKALTRNRCLVVN